MENSLYTPSEVLDNNINGEVTKANLPLGKMILLGLLAGAFIAIGGAASNVAVHDRSGKNTGRCHLPSRINVSCIGRRRIIHR